MYKYIMIIVVASLLGGCKKYLSEEPRRQASVQTAEQLETIINNNSTFVGNVHFAPSGYSTDDTDFPVQAYTANTSVWSIENLLHFIFDTQQLASATSDGFWNGEYRKILHANIVLENVERVSGSAELKNQLKADAYLFRAFSYWQLANTYCLPYSKNNENTLGLPVKNQADYGESLKRSTLKQTYELIENDLLASKELAPDEVKPRLLWRASKKAVDAMLSRFYLFTGEYAKSLEQSNLALSSAVAVLVDYNTLKAGNTQALPWAPGVTLNYSELNDWSAALYLYWKEFYFARFYYNSSQWNIPSASLFNLYDQANDLRFKWFMIPNSNYRFQINAPSLYRYTMFEDGGRMPFGPTVSEMLLNKAEVLARSGDIGGAMLAVNQLRDKRMKTSLPLTAASAAEAITKVLQERRREMPFSMRWYDIRRFSVNDYPGDDVTVQHTFFPIQNRAVNTTAAPVTYTLAPGSLRYAVPVNQLEIVNSENQIEQNKY